MSRYAETIADGQLTTTATQLADGSDTPNGKVSAFFCNAADVEATLTVTFSRGGGTARRLARATLQPNESLRITDLPLGTNDSVSAYAGVASAIDYLITVGGAGGHSMNVGLAGADGAARSALTGEVTLSALEVETVGQESSQAELASLLRRLVLGVEILTGRSLPDPA